jgi:hypothetical protein
LLLTTVATLHHERVSEALDDGAVDLLEASLLVATSSERKEDLGLNGFHVQVSHERDVLNLDALVGPFSEELNLSSVLNLSIIALDDVSIYTSTLIILGESSLVGMSLTFRSLVSHLLLKN